jgi:hypothetical protein
MQRNNRDTHTDECHVRGPGVFAEGYDRTEPSSFNGSRTSFATGEIERYHILYPSYLMMGFKIALHLSYSL